MNDIWPFANLRVIINALSYYHNIAWVKKFQRNWMDTCSIHQSPTFQDPTLFLEPYITSIKIVHTETLLIGSQVLPSLFWSAATLEFWEKLPYSHLDRPISGLGGLTEFVMSQTTTWPTHPYTHLSAPLTATYRAFIQFFSLSPSKAVYMEKLGWITVWGWF